MKEVVCDTILFIQTGVLGTISSRAQLVIDNYTFTVFTFLFRLFALQHRTFLRGPKATLDKFYFDFLKTIEALQPLAPTTWWNS